MKGDLKFAPKFKVVSIDAWADEDGWTWNESHTLFTFRSSAGDLKRTFLARLRTFLANGVQTIGGLPQHIDLGKGWFYVDDDWNIMELRARKDHRPFYACIRETPSHG